MKILNEIYLQQRIEELEVLKRRQFCKENLLLYYQTEAKIDELKQLLSNCEEVEAEKIKFAMGQLNKAKDLDILTVYNNLKQQLKSLENDSN